MFLWKNEDMASVFDIALHDDIEREENPIFNFVY